MTDALIAVGRVVGLHGVSGKLKVNLFSGDPSGMRQVKNVRLSAPATEGAARRQQTFEVISAQRVRGCAVFHLKGIDSVEAAQSWMGAEAAVPRDELPEPDAGEYYVNDLIGCEMVGEDGGVIGKVADVMPGPAHDWLQVRRTDGGEAFLPLIEAFVREVDIPSRRIRVSPPEGWIDAV
ncbi:MAG TPA: ribosome maturation factor RimM [Candidatus Deferrimicrobiaceae bacterium]